MTRGAGTTSARVVPGAWPGFEVHVASSVVSKQSRFSDFLWCRDFSEVHPDGGAVNTKAFGVPPGACVSYQIGGVRVALARTSSFWELERARLTVKQNFGRLSLTLTRNHLGWSPRLAGT